MTNGHDRLEGMTHRFIGWKEFFYYGEMGHGRQL